MLARFAIETRDWGGTGRSYTLTPTGRLGGREGVGEARDGGGGEGGIVRGEHDGVAKHRLVRRLGGVGAAVGAVLDEELPLAHAAARARQVGLRHAHAVEDADARGGAQPRDDVGVARRADVQEVARSPPEEPAKVELLPASGAGRLLLFGCLIAQTLWWWLDRTAN